MSVAIGAVAPSGTPSSDPGASARENEAGTRNDLVGRKTKCTHVSSFFASREGRDTLAPLARCCVENAVAGHASTMVRVKRSRWQSRSRNDISAPRGGENTDARMPRPIESKLTFRRIHPSTRRITLIHVPSAMAGVCDLHDPVHARRGARARAGGCERAARPSRTAKRSKM